MIYNIVCFTYCTNSMWTQLYNKRPTSASVVLSLVMSAWFSVTLFTIKTNYTLNLSLSLLHEIQSNRLFSRKSLIIWGILNICLFSRNYMFQKAYPQLSFLLIVTFLALYSLWTSILCSDCTSSAKFHSRNKVRKAFWR